MNKGHVFNSFSYTKIFITGYIVSIIIGSLMHFIYDISSNNYILGLIFPKNESIFEHLKLIYLPIFLFTIYFYFITDKKFNSIFLFSFIASIIGIICVILINKITKNLFKNNIVMLDILNYVISMFIAFTFLYIAVNNVYLIITYKELNILGILLYLLLGLIFAYFTINPPDSYLFIDESIKSIFILQKST